MPRRSTKHRGSRCCDGPPVIMPCLRAGSRTRRLTLALAPVLARTLTLTLTLILPVTLPLTLPRTLTLTLIKAAGLIKLLPYPDAGEATLPEVHTCTRDMHLPPYAHRHQVADRLYKLLEHSDGGFNKE